MSTQSQDRKVQIVETFDQASADAQTYGDKIHSAFTRIYFLAQDDEDPQAIKDAFTEALKNRAKLDGVIQAAGAAISGLVNDGDPVERSKVDHLDKQVTAAQDLAQQIDQALGYVVSAAARGQTEKIYQWWDRAQTSSDKLEQLLGKEIPYALDEAAPGWGDEATETLAQRGENASDPDSMRERAAKELWRVYLLTECLIQMQELYATQAGERTEGIRFVEIIHRKIRQLQELLEDRSLPIDSGHELALEIESMIVTLQPALDMEERHAAHELAETIAASMFEIANAIELPAETSEVPA